MNPKSMWIRWPSSSSRMLPLCLRCSGGAAGGSAGKGTAQPHIGRRRPPAAQEACSPGARRTRHSSSSGPRGTRRHTARAPVLDLQQVADQGVGGQRLDEAALRAHKGGAAGAAVLGRKVLAQAAGGAQGGTGAGRVSCSPGQLTAAAHGTQRTEHRRRQGGEARSPGAGRRLGLEGVDGGRVGDHLDQRGAVAGGQHLRRGGREGDGRRARDAAARRRGAQWAAARGCACCAGSLDAASISACPTGARPPAFRPARRPCRPHAPRTAAARAAAAPRRRPRGRRG